MYLKEIRSAIVAGLQVKQAKGDIQDHSTLCGNYKGTTLTGLILHWTVILSRRELQAPRLVAEDNPTETAQVGASTSRVACGADAHELISG